MIYIIYYLRSEQQIKMIFEYLLSIPKTVFFNFYYLPIKNALKLPIIVSYRVKIGKLGKRSCLVIPQKRCKIRIGFHGSFNMGGNSYWYIGKSGKVIFEGNADIRGGVRIIANGILEFGNNFFANANCIFNTCKKIKFGDDCIVGWNSSFLDADGHIIIKNNGEKNLPEEIIVRQHVMISSNVSVLKGSLISSNSVVAKGSIITKQFFESNILIGGINKKLDSDINWTR